ncbi:Ubiquitin-conjugating enzyme/RWD [Nannochloropsis gaditana]|uniref:Ubiquitin-fold modifier-conjugating enzyme 1 n=1 Tax=Nannochloropsis gaditana TaxID=72520 RepID=W7TWG9_9STRA|nr:Ubiquitin-conjugating enzyme/RWD [Nannochloropsis gaditana]
MDGGPGGKAGRAEAPASEPMPPVWASTDHAPHVLEEIPMLHTRAGPRDGNQWISRVKEEMQAVIALVRINKEKDNDWFQINPVNKLCTRWEGKCWTYHQGVRFEFTIHFDVPASYPATCPDLIIPHLDGKTAKIYRGGRICLDLHFQPLWARNVPKFGIAHALALGLGPWLSLEIPSLVSAGLLPVTGTTAR